MMILHTPYLQIAPVIEHPHLPNAEYGGGPVPGLERPTAGFAAAVVSAAFVSVSTGIIQPIGLK